MTTQLIPQLAQYLKTTPSYTPSDKMGRIITIAAGDDDDIEIEGELPDLYIPNKEVGINGGGFIGSREFNIPFGRNKKTGKEVVLAAICTVTLTADDWGSVSIDGTTVVDLSSYSFDSL